MHISNGRMMDDGRHGANPHRRHVEIIDGIATITPETNATLRPPAPASCYRGVREKLLQNPSELEAWVRTATPGDNAVYYTGMLAVARLTLAHPKRMASAAQAQAEAGTVLLTQRRVSAFSCEYLITRLSTVQPGLGWWAGTSL